MNAINNKYQTKCMWGNKLVIVVIAIELRVVMDTCTFVFDILKYITCTLCSSLL